MSRSNRSFLISLTLKAALSMAVLCAVFTSSAGAQQAQDDGPTAAAQTINASLVLKARHPDLLETFVAQSQDPTSPPFIVFFHSATSRHCSRPVRAISRPSRSISASSISR